MCVARVTRTAKLLQSKIWKTIEFTDIGKRSADERRGVGDVSCDDVPRDYASAGSRSDWRPRAFFLLFDKLNHTIGLRRPKRRRTPIRPRATGTRRSALRLCGLRRPLPHTIRFTAPEIDEGILILDLRDL